MKKRTALKLLSTAAALSLLAGGAVFADDIATPDSDLDSAPRITIPQGENGIIPLAPGPVISTDDLTLKVNYMDLTAEGAPISYYKDGYRMIPVRAVAEALSYVVGWEQESERVTLTRGAQYITFSLGEDAYTFSKMAPVSLGCPPELVNDGTTYVPAEFLDLLGATYSISIANGSMDIFQMTPVTVLSVDKAGVLTVDDPIHGEVIVNLTEDTVITNNGNPSEAGDIKADTLIHIIYGPAMTMSIPPQTTAVHIEVNPNAVEEDATEAPEEQPAGVAFEATIKEIVDEDSILVDLNGDNVILHITDETNIHHEVNKRLYRADDLEVGMKISGRISEAMTMSIPAQTTALEIVLTD